MLAFVPAVLLVTLAAAMPESAAKMASMTALGKTKIGKVCDPKQRLVCCNKNEKCNEVNVDQLNKSNFLYEHCTATVACCQFDTNINDSKVWGDINNTCVYVGSLTTANPSASNKEVHAHVHN